LTFGFNNLSIKEVSYSEVRDLMATKLDNSKNWVTFCPMFGRGNPNDLLMEFGFIVHMIWEPLDNKTRELDLT